MLADVRRRAFGDQLPVVQHDDAAAQVHQRPHHVLDHHQRQAARGLQTTQGREHRGDFGGGQAGHHLVEQHQACTGGDGSRDLEPLLPGQGQCRCGRVGVGREVELLEHRAGQRVGLGGAACPGLAEQRGGAHVFEHAQRGKGFDDLEGATHAPAADLVGAQANDRLPVVEDVARGRPGIAGDQAEQRRLSGAVRAHQADDLAGLDVERDAVQCGQAAETLAQAAHRQQRRHGTALSGGATPARRRGPKRPARPFGRTSTKTMRIAPRITM